jgi:hypothetical protein
MIDIYELTLENGALCTAVDYVLSFHTHQFIADTNTCPHSGIPATD